MENGYRKSLTWFMKVRWMAFVIIVACFGIIYFIGSNLQSELAPMEDRSQFRLQLLHRKELLMIIWITYVIS